MIFNEFSTNTVQPDIEFNESDLDIRGLEPIVYLNFILITGMYFEVLKKYSKTNEYSRSTVRVPSLSASPWILVALQR